MLGGSFVVIAKDAIAATTLGDHGTALVRVSSLPHSSAAIHSAFSISSSWNRHRRRLLHHMFSLYSQVVEDPEDGIQCPKQIDRTIAGEI